jgi:hypothetical protein
VFFYEFYLTSIFLYKAVHIMYIRGQRTKYLMTLMWLHNRWGVRGKVYYKIDQVLLVSSSPLYFFFFFFYVCRSENLKCHHGLLIIIYMIHPPPPTISSLSPPSLICQVVIIIISYRGNLTYKMLTLNFNTSSI